MDKPGFYTATGAGTFVETGQIPHKFAKRLPGDKGDLKVEIPGIPKDVKIFKDGKRYLLEEAIHGDVAIVRAWKVDKAGNCVFRYATRAFGGLMARAAKLTIVEVRSQSAILLILIFRTDCIDSQAEHIVEIGELSPMDINLPGIYVHRIVPATVDKVIELITTSPDPSSTSSPTDASPASLLTGEKLAARLRREKIAKRCAKELKEGYYANLGVGTSVSRGFILYFRFI